MEVDSAVYLDCNATAPVDPRVAELVFSYLTDHLGNAGSRSHEYGAQANRAVERAREQVAAVVSASPEEVVFTSGATEANNLAILGLAAHGQATGRKHILSSEIEHKAVLEPLESLQEAGFEVELVRSTPGGWVSPEEISSRLREDTLLVSVMQVNNETGVAQPLSEIADLLEGHEAYLHSDAAQGFGKDIESLKHPRLDLVSLSGHKIYGPMGIGALVARRRKSGSPPISSLVYGGGQERGLRPGTLPVALVAGFGLCAELAASEFAERADRCLQFKEALLENLGELNPQVHGDPARTLPNTINFSVGELDSEVVMLALKGVVAISNGSACTSATYEPSYVLKAMGLSEKQASTAMRWSWCHDTPQPDWAEVVANVRRYL